MKRISVFVIIAFSFISSWPVAVADQAGFIKGQRHANDLARDVTSKPQQIIAFAGVKKGMVIGDVFGGGGYYSELLSKAVGKQGKISS